MNQMNIAISVPILPPRLEEGGGCSLRYYTLIDKFLKNGCKVVVFTVTPFSEVNAFNKGRWLNYLLNHQLRIVLLESCRNSMYPNVSITKISYKNTRTVYKTLKDSNVNVFLTHDNSDTLLNILISRILRVPSIIYGIHTDLDRLIQVRDISRLFKIMFKLGLFMNSIMCNSFATRTVTSSESCRTQIQSRFVYKYLKIDGFYKSYLWSNDFKHNPVINNTWKNRLTRNRPNKNLCVYVGRWSKEKRIPMLVDAIPNDWVLAIVGDGPDSSDILQLESDNVVVINQFLSSDDLTKVYNCADFVVSASNFETFGFVAKEAIACGTPVCVEKAGGFLDHVIHNKNGFLVDYSKPEEVRFKLNQYSKDTIQYYKLKRRILEYTQINEEDFLQDFIDTHSTKNPKPKRLVFHYKIMLGLSFLGLKGFQALTS